MTQVPHFTVRTVFGDRVAYQEIWQRRNVVLVVLDEGEASKLWLTRASSRMAELTAHTTACVITREEVPGVPRPGLLVADRWGEVHLARGADSEGRLPDVDELVEWLRYVQVQCPECQGEAR